MKLIVTILQARRVVLPYFFVRYAVPRMQAVWPGEIDVVIVQHRSPPTVSDGFLSTSSDTAEGEQRVGEWTSAGRFAPAKILPHSIQLLRYPSIPSMHLACQQALESGADYHLWLEDDALVCDERCATWPKRFGRREIGVYRHFSAINSAFFVSRPSFDERILPGLSRYDEWSKKTRLEGYLQRMLRTTRVHFNPAFAVRTHVCEWPYTGTRFVATMVRKLSSNEAELLDIECGVGASQLPDVTRAELLKLTWRDWARTRELIRRIQYGLIERLRGLSAR